MPSVVRGDSVRRFVGVRIFGRFGFVLQEKGLGLLSSFGSKHLLFGIAAKSANRFGHLITLVHRCAIIRATDFYV